jgi:flagellar basal body-associated protein FliL
MAIPKEKLNPLHWGTLILLIIVIAAAIYAMTTWNDSKSTNQTAKFPGHSSQLLDQNHAVNLQANPGSGNGGSSTGLQSAGSTAESSGDPNASSQTAPPTSGVCGPPRDGRLSEVMCPL